MVHTLESLILNCDRFTLDGAELYCVKVHGKRKRKVKTKFALGHISLEIAHNHFLASWAFIDHVSLPIVLVFKPKLVFMY